MSVTISVQQTGASRCKIVIDAPTTTPAQIQHRRMHHIQKLTQHCHNPHRGASRNAVTTPLCYKYAHSSYDCKTNRSTNPARTSSSRIRASMPSATSASESSNPVLVARLDRSSSLNASPQESRTTSSSLRTRTHSLQRQLHNGTRCIREHCVSIVEWPDCLAAVQLPDTNKVRSKPSTALLCRYIC